MTDKPIALDAYETLAAAYAAAVDTKPHNAYYERPATLSQNVAPRHLPTADEILLRITKFFQSIERNHYVFILYNVRETALHLTKSME